MNRSTDMALSGHLCELRIRLLRIALVGAIGFTIVYLMRDRIFEQLLKAADRLGYNFVYISPQEIFITEIKVSLCGAMIVIFPAMLIEFTGFVLPALEREVKRIRLALMYIAGQGLFLLGMAFSYLALVPFIMKFLYLYSVNSFASSSISIEKYTSFVISIILAVVFVFELPLANAILCKIGLLSAETLKKIRPGVIIAIFIVAAFITPPDVISQILVAVPMLLLYEVSIRICSFMRKGESIEEK